jgi:RNA polymerase sigma-70 factor (ECF subfamily)
VGFEDDEHLVATAQGGSLDAFNGLVARYQSAAYGLALRLVRDSAAAEDVTQESFLAAWSNLHTYRGGQFRSWLLRIVANRSYDELRRRGRRPADSLDALPVEPEGEWTTQVPSEGPESYALRRELSRRLQQAIDGLPHDQRLVLILADVQGHTYEEIAEITDANLGTIKSRLSRARGRVRDALRQDGELFERYLRHEDEQPST